MLKMNMLFLNASRGENRLFEGQRPSWIHREGHGLFLRSLENPLGGDLMLNSPTESGIGLSRLTWDKQNTQSYQ